MTQPTYDDVMDFLRCTNLTEAFDAFFPQMAGRHFRVYPVKTCRDGYVIEVVWYAFDRALTGPLSHEEACNMKQRWDLQILPDLKHSFRILIGGKERTFLFYHRKGHIAIPP